MEWAIKQWSGQLIEQCQELCVCVSCRKHAELAVLINIIAGCAVREVRVVCLKEHNHGSAVYYR